MVKEELDHGRFEAAMSDINQAVSDSQHVRVAVQAVKVMFEGAHMSGKVADVHEKDSVVQALKSDMQVLAAQSSTLSDVQLRASLTEKVKDAKKAYADYANHLFQPSKEDVAASIASKDHYDSSKYVAQPHDDFEKEEVQEDMDVDNEEQLSDADNEEQLSPALASPSPTPPANMAEADADGDGESDWQIELEPEDVSDQSEGDAEGDSDSVNTE